MERPEAKRRIAVLVSDMGLLKQMPEGRTDRLADELASGQAPQFWIDAVTKMPPKGSRDWRWAKDYALWGKVPQRKPRAPRARRVTETKLPVEEGECLRCAMEGGHDGECVYHE